MLIGALACAYKDNLPGPAHIETTWACRDQLREKAAPQETENGW